MSDKATRINLFSVKTIQMRTFHMSWFAFFLCFFAWFGIAPLMKVVRAELGLTQAQIGNCIIASVAITVLARLVVGWLCDRIGPRLSYTWLLVLGSIPVMGIGFAQSYESFLLFRLAIGVIGASFVITQYHTSVMFAPNVVALYFADYFDLGLKTAGIVAALFGLMNIFARSLGGFMSDRFGARWGLRGRARWLFMALFAEGVFLILFSRMDLLPAAVAVLLCFSVCVQMSSGATFSVVPFINKRALGSVAGIVGAGGNMGAVLAGFLFKGGIAWPNALLCIGVVVLCVSFVSFAVRFSEAAEKDAAGDLERILATLKAA